MASFMSNKAKRDMLAGSILWLTDTIRILLVKGTNATAENPDHDFLSQAVDGVNGIEADATNYARKTLASKGINEDDANDRAEIDAGDVTWTSLGGTTDNTIVGAWIYKQVGGDDTTPGDDPIIFFIDIADTSTNGGDFTIQWDAEGICQFA